MTDKHITVDSIRWFRVLPWLHLLKAGQLALRVRVLLVSLCAVVVFGLGEMAIRRLPFQEARGERGTIFLAIDSTSLSRESARIPSLNLNPCTDDGRRWMAWPLLTFVNPVHRLFSFSTHSWSAIAARWTELLWAVLAWGLCGGAMARMHGVRFARDDSVSPIQAVRFAGRLWQSYLYAPLLPLLGVVVLMLPGILIGRADVWFTGGNGGVTLAFGWLAMLTGLLMALLLLFIFASWPLMVAAISVEGSDGFDGLSRAFGYVMNRPWYFVFLVLMAFGVGLAVALFVEWLFQFAWGLAEFSTGARPESSFAAWKDFLTLLQLAVLVSYFWSAATVVYFLLRQADDGTPLDQVYMSGPPPTPEPLPLVGVAASNQPIIERPAT